MMKIAVAIVAVVYLVLTVDGFRREGQRGGRRDLCGTGRNGTLPGHLPNGSFDLRSSHYLDLTCGSVELVPAANNSTSNNSTSARVVSLIHIFLQRGDIATNESYLMIHHQFGQYLLIPVGRPVGVNETQRYRVIQVFATHLDILIVSCPQSRNETREVYVGGRNASDSSGTPTADQNAQDLNVTNSLVAANQTACPPGFFVVSQSSN